jgi:hypothetical protein
MTKQQLSAEQIRRLEECGGNLTDLDDGYMLSVGDEDWLATIREICGPGWVVDWAGSGATDSDGDTTEDIRISPTPAKILYLRYRIDASRDLGSDRMHDASEAVDREWHDTEDEAIAYAQELADEDDELILTVGEYAIEMSSEPTDSDWNDLRTRQPRRKIEVFPLDDAN